MTSMSRLSKTPAHKARRPGARHLQFHGEFFNVFKLVNFGLPAQTCLGRVSAASAKRQVGPRQIQFSLKVIFQTKRLLRAVAQASKGTRSLLTLPWYLG